jgi:hypothetical protein
MVPGQAREHDVSAAPIAFGFPVPPGLACSVSPVRFAGTVPPGSEDVAGSFVAKLIKVTGEACMKIAAHLRQNPARGFDVTELQLAEGGLDSKNFGSRCGL